MKPTSVEVKVERVSSTGILCDGKWYNLSKWSDVTIDSFKEGKEYALVVNEGKNGGYFIESAEPLSETFVEPVTEPTTKKKRLVKLAEPEAPQPTSIHSLVGPSSPLTTKDLLILAQNTLGNVQSSPEWANMSLTLGSDEERNKAFEAKVDFYFDKALRLAGVR